MAASCRPFCAIHRQEEILFEYRVNRALVGIGDYSGYYAKVSGPVYATDLWNRLILSDSSLVLALDIIYTEDRKVYDSIQQKPAPGMTQRSFTSSIIATKFFYLGLTDILDLLFFVYFNLLIYHLSSIFFP